MRSALPRAASAALAGLAALAGCSTLPPVAESAVPARVAAWAPQQLSATAELRGLSVLNDKVAVIRALLAADKSLSTTARQITIVAAKGRVRLTGQVNTAEERAAIERSARKAANVIDVKNQLVVMQ